MACRIDRPLLVVATLTAFFATFFAILLFLRNPARPEPQPAAEPAAAPSVDAGPPELGSDSMPESLTNAPPSVLDQLQELGVRCADGVDCEGQ